MIQFKSTWDDEAVEVKMTIHKVEGLSEVMQEFRHFLLAIGFQPGSIDEYIEAE